MIASASTFDGAREPRLQPARAAGVVGAGTFFVRNGCDPLPHGSQGRFGIAGKRRGLLALSDKRAEDAVCFSGLVEAAVEQRVGNADLSLHAFGERNVSCLSRAYIEDEIGFKLEHPLQVSRVAASGEPTDLGTGRDLGKEVDALLGPDRARPT